MDKIDQWMEVYEQKLVESHAKHPELYAYPANEIPFTVHRMRGAFKRGSYNKDSHAIKATCKHFGVKHTYKAIKSFLNAPAFKQALQNISNFSKCQCKDQHGDNPNCAVLIAERALQKL